MVKSNDEIIAISERGIPLITQKVDVAHLTFEDYEKWYSPYVLYPNGEVVELKWNWDGWYDHCIAPRRFIELAESNGLKFDQETYNRVYQMFSSCHCGWNEVPEEYLPDTSIITYTGGFEFLNDN